MSDDEQQVDFAIAAHRDESGWHVEPVDAEMIDTVDELLEALHQQAPGAAEVLGLVSVADDFFLLVRSGNHGLRILVSDGSAASEWSLARTALDQLGIPVPDDDDEQVEPAGDLGIVADLGLDAMELAALCDDLDLYPDEVLGSVASRLGFAEPFQRAVEASA